MLPRSIYAVALALVATLISPLAAEEPVRASKTDTVKDHRYMESNVTLYKNGQLAIQTKCWSRKRFGGLTGQSLFVVCVDDKGNAIWVSKAFPCKTVGGLADVGTASEHTQTHTEALPEAIGKHTKAIDIFHDAGDISKRRQDQVEDVKKAIEQASDVAAEVKAAVAKL